MNYKINYTIGGSNQTVGQSVFQPKNKDELKSAVNEWTTNKTSAKIGRAHV